MRQSLDSDIKDPFTLFETWFNLEQQLTGAAATCCFSTIGLDDYPNARFVALKEVTNHGFVICGPLKSRKGREIEACSNSAITFWWPESRKQVRIQGNATTISGEEADRYFIERSFEARVVSVISRQGESTAPGEMEKLFSNKLKTLQENEIKRPLNWGGLAIKPKRIEFMVFNENRLHQRMLYELENSEWKKRFLQP